VQVLSPSEVPLKHPVGGWNEQTRPFTVYFYAVTDTPAASFGTWNPTGLHPARADESRGHAAGRMSRTSSARTRCRSCRFQVPKLAAGVSVTA